MKAKMRLINTLLFGLLLLTNLVFSEKKLNIVTTTLDAADFVKQIGGDNVEVYSLYNGQYDFHFYEPRPTEVLRLKKADAVVVYGLAHDGWFQSLLESSRNSKITFGRKGYIDMADGVKVMKVPSGNIDGRMGDVHPYGACGYLYNEENVKRAVENIYNGLVNIAPEYKEYFEKNKNNYLSKVDSVFVNLKGKMLPYKGTKIVQFHESWDYFAETFGLEIVAALEPKPGIPPSAAHLSNVKEIIKKESPKIILVETYYPQKPVKFITQQTGIKEVRVAQYVGGVKGRETFISNLEYTIDKILEALNN